MTAQLLFLAGLGRSGTTALLEVMSAHPDVALGVERYKRLYPQGARPVTRDLFERDRFFDFGDGLTNLTPEQAPEWAAHYEAMRAKWDTARFVGDKMVAVRIQHVWTSVPDARFVCIARDLEPVAASWHRRALDPDDLGWAASADAHAAVERWNRAMRRIRRAVSRRPDLATVVEYDRFFGDAAGSSLLRVLDWLGLDRAPQVEAAFARAHRTYVEQVLPRRPSLEPETRAFLAEHEERDAWDDVVALAL